MLEDRLDDLPKDHRDLSASFKSSHEYSQRVLQPEVFITRSEDSYQGHLGASVTTAGSKEFVFAPSNAHNWIFHKGIIRPLPFDAPEELSRSLETENLENLSYPQILMLYKKGSDAFDVHFDPGLFENANSASLSLPDPGQIAGLDAKLYPYQSKGVAWLNDSLHRLGGSILADEMGLGKTLQIIASILLEPPEDESPVLVLCPTSLILNWQREIYKFAPSLKVLIHRGSGRTGYYKDLLRTQVVITTYDTLSNDISLFRGVDWSYVVCDEAQALKNPEAKRRKAVSRLHRRYTIPVTGTPVENSLVDLWSLSDLAIPGVLGELSEFESSYPDSEDSAIELGYITDSYVLKRRVSDVAQDLPERTDIDVPIAMHESDWATYQQVRDDAISKYGQAGRMVAVGQLAMYCAHPWLVATTASNDGWDENASIVENSSALMTPKLQHCLRIVTESFTSNRKVLIFASFNSCSELIQLAAKENELPKAFWGKINGSTPAEERQQLIDEFSNETGAAVLVLNPRAAGAGLNITAATVVIHFTQNWNPALELQASARAHRRGQELPVTIYRLFYEGTVEETMIERSQWKRDMGEAAVPIAIRDNHDLDSALNKCISDEEENDQVN